MSPEVEFALNNTVHKSTGETRSKLLFGMNQHFKVIDAQLNNETCDLKHLCTNSNVKIVKAKQNNKNYFDRKRKTPRKYQNGDYVMILNVASTPGPPKKLLRVSKDPYQIIKVNTKK